MLSKHGFDPKRDVTMVLIGATPDRFAALRRTQFRLRFWSLLTISWLTWTVLKN